MKTVTTTAQARYYKVPTTITVADHIADKMLATGQAVEVDGEQVVETKPAATEAPAAKETKTITKNKIKTK